MARDTSTKRPIAANLLVGLLVVLGIGGFMGAYGFLADTSGGIMGLTPAVLAGLSVSDLLLVGLSLLGVYGILSLRSYEETVQATSKTEMPHKRRA